MLLGHFWPRVKEMKDSEPLRGPASPTPPPGLWAGPNTHHTSCAPFGTICSVTSGPEPNPGPGSPHMMRKHRVRKAPSPLGRGAKPGEELALYKQRPVYVLLRPPATLPTFLPGCEISCMGHKGPFHHPPSPSSHCLRLVEAAATRWAAGGWWGVSSQPWPRSSLKGHQGRWEEGCL